MGVTNVNQTQVKLEKLRGVKEQMEASIRSYGEILERVLFYQITVFLICRIHSYRMTMLV